MKLSLPFQDTIDTYSQWTSIGIDQLSTRNRIIKIAAPIFLKNGYRKTSVDQLANYLGISKKTFYKIFRSKHELIHQTQPEIYSLITNLANQVFSESSDGIEYAYRLKYQLNQTFGFYQQLLNFKELSDSYQKTALQIEATYMKAAEYSCNKGIRIDRKGNLINKDINIELANFSFSRGYINFLVNTNYDRADYEKVFELWFYMFIKGLLNKKGVSILKERIENEVDIIYPSINDFNS